MKKFYILSCALALSSLSFAQTKDSVAMRFSKLVKASGMSENLHVLASDEYEGRETGMKGQKMAAEYISAFFKKSGIPAYNNSYFQRFPLMLYKPQKLTLNVNDKDFKQGEDFYSFSSASKDSTFIVEELIFAGYGVRTDQYNDYKDLGVKGKHVIILDGEPMDKEKNSLITGSAEVSEWTANYRFKLNEARAQGIAVLFIVEQDIKTQMEKNEHNISSYRMKLEEDHVADKMEGLTVIRISPEVADLMLKKSKKTSADLRKKISKKKQPLNFTFKTTIKMRVNQTHERISAENVLGYLEGSDLKNELVVITAHYDHLGKHDGVVYNGADDDGSGTVAVMELAQAFAEAKKQGKGPRRSILFMTVSGEEKGLLGSDYYSRHPVFDMKNTVADLNIDMIGRLDDKHKNNSDYIYIIGSDMLSTQLHNINEEANKKYVNLNLDYTYNATNDPNRYYYRSDHYNFAKKGVPVIFYFNGVHADYHKETDEVQKIDFAKMEKITRLVFFTAWELVNRNDRISVDKLPSKE